MSPFQKGSVLIVAVAIVGLLQLFLNPSDIFRTLEARDTSAGDSLQLRESGPNNQINALFNTGEQHSLVQNIYQAGTAGLFFEVASENEQSHYIDTPMQDSQFDVQVTGNIVRTRVTQTFTNTTATWQQGTYIFPLPHDAVVDAMLMRIGNRTIEGVITEKQQAEKSFKQAQRDGKSASLVNQLRPNMFINKIANIAPQSTIEVKIEYQQVLHLDNKRYQLRIPTSITPRYTPHTIQDDKTTAQAITSMTMNDKTRLATHGELRINVDINMGTALQNIVSEHHAINTRRAEDKGYRVTLDSKAIHPPEEFVLTWELDQPEAPEAIHLTQNIGGYQYGLIQIVPPQTPKTQFARNITFILDTSGSMVGDAISQAKAALVTGIKALEAHESFNVIEFNSRAQNLWQSAQFASAENKQQAIAFISMLQASGGTEIADALTLAFSLHHASNQTDSSHLLQQIVFITDGSVTNEAQILQMISKELNEARLFTIGIGSAPNTYFMTEAASAGKGTFTFIGDIAQVDEKMTTLLKKIQRPALTNIELSMNAIPATDVLEVYPKIVPDAYAGEPLTLVYRREYNADTQARISIQAHWYKSLTKNASTPMLWQSQLPAKSAKPNAGLTQQWAYEKIRQLSRTLHTSAAEGEERLALQTFTKQEITETALAHKLVSKYTSLLAIDDQVTRPSQELLEQLAVQAKQLSEQRKQWIAASVQLPQTATHSVMLLFYGLVLLVVAFATKRLSNDRSA
jgi:Ca-activated chloride channel family protein